MGLGAVRLLSFLTALVILAGPAWSQRDRQVLLGTPIVDLQRNDTTARGADIEDVTRVIFELTGGMAWPPTGRFLPDSNQRIDGDFSGLFRLASGIMLPYHLGPANVGVNLVVQGEQWRPNNLVNVGGGGNLPLGGRVSAVSVYPEVALETPLAGGWVDWRVAFGAGLAFQSVKATNGGATVLSGSATTGMVNLSTALLHPVTENFKTGIVGGLAWAPGFTANAGGTPIRVGRQTDAYVAWMFSFRVGVTESR